MTTASTKPVERRGWNPYTGDWTVVLRLAQDGIFKYFWKSIWEKGYLFGLGGPRNGEGGRQSTWCCFLLQTFVFQNQLAIGTNPKGAVDSAIAWDKKSTADVHFRLHQVAKMSVKISSDHKFHRMHTVRYSGWVSQNSPLAEEEWQSVSSYFHVCWRHQTIWNGTQWGYPEGSA